MDNLFLKIDSKENELFLIFKGEFTLYQIKRYQNLINEIKLTKYIKVIIDLEDLTFIDTGSSIYINNLYNKILLKDIKVIIKSNNSNILDTLSLVRKIKQTDKPLLYDKKRGFMDSLGKVTCNLFSGFFSFLAFFGELFLNTLSLFKSTKNFRYKEILFEINESTIKALPIIALASLLVGVVMAYQSANQLSLYGANIFIVDMLGLSMLRELSPVLTAIIIAGRSGSSYTAQIGAMKITQELDAMRSMGFDPYKFLVLPRIIALMLMMPVLIFVSDTMSILGGMIVADLNLGISFNLFIDRFNNVIELRHFLVGIGKGPFFAFLIALIGIYRGLKVKDDTQSIGYNTTKSVVESIFAVIICDAIFSIIFTNLGI